MFRKIIGAALGDQKYWVQRRNGEASRKSIEKVQTRDGLQWCVWGGMNRKAWILKTGVPVMPQWVNDPACLCGTAG